MDSAAATGDCLRDDLALERIGPALESWIAPTIRRHEGLCAEREAALKRQREIVHELEARDAELAAKELPDPPLLGWQQRTGRCLAELVDFKEHLDGPARAGLEGALEASGLLAAEVHRGALRLADGQVVIAPDGNEVAAPLGSLLRSDAENGVDADMRGNIERILRAISTDPAAGADTVVTPEGEFRLGALCGRHLKREAEHIGVSARRAALERQRAQSALALAQAKEQCERLADDAESARAALDEAVKLRARIPSDRPLQSAMWQRNSSQKDAQRAEEQLSARRSALQSAELRHAEAVAHAQGTASGAELRYHGDFDTAGLAICARVMALGLIPWRMSAADYLEAVASADAEGAVLPRDTRAPGPTPWEPSLQSIFAQSRRIVHQERLLSALIGAR